MKKFVLILVIITLVLFFSSMLMATSLQKSIIPADVQWLVHIDIEKFNASEFSKLASQIPGFGNISREIYREVRINPLKDLTGITIYGTGREEEDTVVCFAGNVNRDYLLELLGMEDSHRERQYGKYTIHNWDRDGYGVFVNDKLALIAKEGNNLKKALDVFNGKKEGIQASPMIKHINEFPKNAFLMASVENIASLMLGVRDKPFILKKTGAAHISAVEDDKILNLKLKLATDSAETAENIEQMVRGFIAMGNLTIREKAPDMEKLLDNITVAREGDMVRLDVSIPTDDLRNINEFLHGIHEVFSIDAFDSLI